MLETPSSVMSATVAKPLEPISLPKADACVIVIFGATGDLTRRKLMPALFRLMCEGCLDDVLIFCIGRSPTSDEEFRKTVREGLESSSKIETCSDHNWDQFTKRISYITG